MRRVISLGANRKKKLNHKGHKGHKVGARFIAPGFGFGNLNAKYAKHLEQCRKYCFGAGDIPFWMNREFSIFGTE